MSAIQITEVNDILPVAEARAMTDEEQLQQIEKEEKELATKKKLLLLKKEMDNVAFQKDFVNYSINQLTEINNELNINNNNNKQQIEYYERLIEKMNNDIEKNEDVIQKNNDKLEGLNQCKEILDDDEEEEILDLSQAIKDYDLNNELDNYYLHLQKNKTIIRQTTHIKKPSVKKPTKTIKKDAEVSSLSSSDTKKTRTYTSKDRPRHWKLLPIGTELYINHKGHTGTYTKIDEQTLRYNVEGKTGDCCVLSAGKGKNAVALNGACMEFLDIIGVERRKMNAWFEFKVNVDGKMVSVGDYAERLDN
jgi:hypothetical protein